MVSLTTGWAPKPPKIWLNTAKAPSANAASVEDPALAWTGTTRERAPRTSSATTVMVFFIAWPPPPNPLLPVSDPLTDWPVRPFRKAQVRTARCLDGQRRSQESRIDEAVGAMIAPCRGAPSATSADRL